MTASFSRSRSLFPPWLLDFVGEGDVVRVATLFVRGVEFRLLVLFKTQKRGGPVRTGLYDKKKGKKLPNLTSHSNGLKT